MEKYYIILDEMTIDEIEVWRCLCRHSNFKSNIAGYTVAQIVASADSRLNLTTQKVRTILKGFENKGYIEHISKGGKGKESTCKLTIKQQLFNNYSTNKSEQLQQVDELPSNNLTTNQQLINNTTKKKKKENNININLIESYTENNDLKEAIKDFISMRKSIKKPLTERALKTILNKLDKFADNDASKIEILEASIEKNWLTVYEQKEKANYGKSANKNTLNNNISNSTNKNARIIKEV